MPTLCLFQIFTAFFAWRIGSKLGKDYEASGCKTKHGLLLKTLAEVRPKSVQKGRKIVIVVNLAKL